MSLQHYRRVDFTHIPTKMYLKKDLIARVFFKYHFLSVIDKYPCSIYKVSQYLCIFTRVQARRHDFVIRAKNGGSRGVRGHATQEIFYSRMLSGAFSRIFGTVYSLPLVHIILACVTYFLQRSVCCNC
jgi:hypothetical protein